MQLVLLAVAYMQMGGLLLLTSQLVAHNSSSMPPPTVIEVLLINHTAVYFSSPGVTIVQLPASAACYIQGPGILQLKAGHLLAGRQRQRLMRVILRTHGQTLHCNIRGAVRPIHHLTLTQVDHLQIEQAKRTHMCHWYTNNHQHTQGQSTQ